MKPIYFPFTFIPEPAAEALSLFFRQIVIYQPSNRKIPEKMQNEAESGFLDIRIPVTGDEVKLDAVLKDYTNWANIHRRDNLTFFRPWIEKTPFRDNNSVSQIMAEIKNKQSMKPDSLFHARIFLHIAQEFDIQKMEINSDLFSVEAMKMDFLKKIMGEEEGAGEEKIESDTQGIIDSGSYMTAERLDAWTRLFQEDEEPSGLFITTSPAVFEYLMEKVPEIKMVRKFDSIPSKNKSTENMGYWRDRLNKYLDTFEKNGRADWTEDMKPARISDTGGETVSFTLYRIPGKAPRDFFRRFLIRGESSTRKKKDDEKSADTLVGIVAG